MVCKRSCRWPRNRSPRSRPRSVLRADRPHRRPDTKGNLPMIGSTTRQSTTATLPYSPPALVALGTVRAVTLGSLSSDTADKKRYYN
ncbi:lasso RiPP family leader peptide-containing protein [Nonomuraea sp. NPDC049504]|uniref:lasso RiPP family leader peptide-containing protein n=1 Tax=Nonomuraea sp. NPDC049504 TaxID=3154729 RepID=UPI0034441EF9